MVVVVVVVIFTVTGTVRPVRVGTRTVRVRVLLVRRVVATRYLPRFGARWLKALAAAVLDTFEVRPSRNTFEAALAALALVFRPAMMVLLLVSWSPAGTGPPGTSYASARPESRAPEADSWTRASARSLGVRLRSATAAGEPRDEAWTRA